MMSQGDATMSATSGRSWTPERREAHTRHYEELMADPVRSAALNKKLKGTWTEERREALRQRNRERIVTAEQNERRRQAISRAFTEERRQAASQRLKTLWTDPDFRARSIERTRRLWTDQDFRRKISRAGCQRSFVQRQTASDTVKRLFTVVEITALSIPQRIAYRRFRLKGMGRQEALSYSCDVTDVAPLPESLSLLLSAPLQMEPSEMQLDVLGMPRPAKRPHRSRKRHPGRPAAHPPLEKKALKTRLPSNEEMLQRHSLAIEALQDAGNTVRLKDRRDQPWRINGYKMTTMALYRAANKALERAGKAALTIPVEVEA